VALGRQLPADGGVDRVALSGAINTLLTFMPKEEAEAEVQAA